MHRGFFIAGTDTGIGKTTISLLLLELLQQRGFTTAALKPIASGAMQTEQGLRNQDALQLQRATTVNLDYNQVNPFVFAPPISPNFASLKANCELTAERILEACQPVLNTNVDVVVVEGIGGWEVPINQTETMADVAKQFNFPVILVVGLRLGCLNHSLLTSHAICKSGLPMAGWVINCIDNDMLCTEENINYLKSKIDAPLLGVVPFFDDVAHAIKSQFSVINLI